MKTNPFKLDVEKFIKENGKVTDKEYAIELLCQSSLAWKILDDSLKNDPEVIMYYQPMGYRVQEWCKYFEYNGYDGIFDSTGGADYIYYGEEGFKFVGEGPSAYFTPEIELPDNFDLDAYRRIQKDLESDSRKLGISETVADGFFTKHATGETNAEDCANEDIYVYNRSRLNSIVKEQIEQKTI